MEATIRNAEPDDAVALARLSGQLGYPSSVEQMRDRMNPLGATGRDGVFVAGVDETVCGWIHVSIRVLLESDPFAEIVGLVVDERLRRSGIGRSLVFHAEDWARQQGIHRIRVRSNMIRTEAKAFYERLGYSVSKQQTVFDRLLEKAR